MATHLIQDTTLSSIADAIRLKAGKSEAFTPAQMVSEIENLPTGGGGDLIDFIENLPSGTFEYSEISKVRDYAFYKCISLQSVNLPNVSYIGNYAFYDCRSLQSVNLSIASYIGSSAFCNCLSLRSVDLPMASYIGNMAFQSCHSLQYVNLPIASYIGNLAFYDCFALQSVNLPVASSIGNSAFTFCSALQSVNLPVVSSIGSSAFYKCYNLLSLYLGSTSVCSLVTSTAFLSTPIAGYTTSTGGTYGSIYVPASLYSYYISARIWSYYSSRFVSVSPTATATLYLEELGISRTITFEEGMTWEDYASSSYDPDNTISFNRGYVNYYDIREGVTVAVTDYGTQEVSTNYIQPNYEYQCN